MGLDPQVQAVLDELAAFGNPNLDQLTPVEARELMNAGARLFSGDGHQDVTTLDARFPGPGGDVPIRVYTPPAAVTRGPSSSTSTAEAGSSATSRPTTASAETWRSTAAR